MKRRHWIASIAALSMARSLLAAANASRSSVGICTFSCHLQWQAVRNKQVGTAFENASSFFDYAQTLGASGVQTSFKELDSQALKNLREKSEMADVHLEGDMRLPKTHLELAEFEREVQSTRETGAQIARTVLVGGRRYETFRSRSDFDEFYKQAKQRLEWVEPILKKHRLKLAIENHKDLTLVEQIAMVKRISSEWIGVLVDTGNNLALLDEPYEVIEQLAPYAFSVHLKDMAVQSDPSGFLLSEVPCGTGFLDLPRMIAVLLKSNPAIVFNLEMATRDPLKIPCRTEGYWATFPDRRPTHLEAAMTLVALNPMKQPPPSISGKSVDRQLADEEANNRNSLAWMRERLS